MSSSPNLIQSVVQAARKTFARSCYHQYLLNSDEFLASFKDLKALLDGLRASDVGLDRSSVIQKSDPTQSSPEAAPVTYIKIHEDRDVSIGIFVVKAGSRIPLHNHPKMHGLLKVSQILKILQILQIDVQVDNFLKNP